VSRAVKVSDNLYVLLQQEAAECGSTIQAALARRLESAEANAQRLSTHCRELTAQLRAAELDRDAARKTRHVEASRVSALQEELRKHREALTQVEQELHEVAAIASDWRAEAEELGKTVARERRGREEKSRKERCIFQVAALGILIAAAFAVWRQWRQASRQRPASADSAQAPTMEKIWER
jgi:hypothetical protein